MRIAVLRPEDSFYFISDICAQEYALLSEGFRQGGKVVCPLHQAGFDIRTGHASDAPAEADIAPCIRRIEGGVVQYEL
jgi:nitrite reductase/ring-hydroxylating ferredoxin subunit